MAWSVIILYRLLLPIGVLVVPLAGSLASVFGDNFDMVVTDLFEVNDCSNYNVIDKTLDSYMYLYMGWIAWKWRRTFTKRLVLSLLAFRLTGVALYLYLSAWHTETDWRMVLVLFPDFFIFVFLYVLIKEDWFKKRAFASRKETVTALSAIFVLKLFQEYALHIAQFPLYVMVKNTLVHQFGIFF